MIDIHTHITPNVDDGSRSVDESVKMIKKMMADGITHIIATPHVQSPATRSTRSEQVDSFNALKAATKDLDVEIILGAEVFYHSHINTDYENLRLGNSRYVLVEFHWSQPTEVIEPIYNLSKSGFKPIIAHVERYPYLNFRDYQEMIDNGAMLQVNASSILGKRGKTEKKLADQLLKRKLVSFIASDAHRIDRRRPNLLEAYKVLEKRLDKDYLEQLFYKNAIKIF